MGEIPLHGCKVIEVAGIAIGIFRLEDGYRAYRDFCPHAGARLCSAENVLDGGQPRLHCPWHGWEFDLATGACSWNARVTLDSYRIDVIDGTVWLEIPEDNLD